MQETRQRGFHASMPILRVISDNGWMHFGYGWNGWTRTRNRTKSNRLPLALIDPSSSFFAFPCPRLLPTHGQLNMHLRLVHDHKEHDNKDAIHGSPSFFCRDSSGLLSRGLQQFNGHMSGGGKQLWETILNGWFYDGLRSRPLTLPHIHIDDLYCYLYYYDYIAYHILSRLLPLSLKKLSPTAGIQDCAQLIQPILWFAGEWTAKYGSNFIQVPIFTSGFTTLWYDYAGPVPNPPTYTITRFSSHRSSIASNIYDSLSAEARSVQVIIWRLNIGFMDEEFDIRHIYVETFQFWFTLKSLFAQTQALLALSKVLLDSAQFYSLGHLVHNLCNSYYNLFAHLIDDESSEQFPTLEKHVHSHLSMLAECHRVHHRHYYLNPSMRPHGRGAIMTMMMMVMKAYALPLILLTRQGVIVSHSHTTRLGRGTSVSLARMVRCPYQLVGGLRHRSTCHQDEPRKQCDEYSGCDYYPLYGCCNLLSTYTHRSQTQEKLPNHNDHFNFDTSTT